LTREVNDQALPFSSSAPMRVLWCSAQRLGSRLDLARHLDVVA